MNVLKKISTSVVILLLSVFALQAQEVLQITGRIIDGNSGRRIPNANIINLKKGTMTHSDTSGFFNLTLLRSDILRISALGYEQEYIAFADTSIIGEKIRIIKMIPKVYNIAAVDIYAARWKDFQFEFKNTELEEDPQQTNMQNWFYTVISEEELKMLSASASVGIPINYKSNRQKQLEKVRRLDRREYEYRIINHKYNSRLIKETVDIPDELVEDFMQFCNFNRAFILSSNKYDLIMEIKKRYKAFRKTLQPGF